MHAITVALGLVVSGHRLGGVAGGHNGQGRRLMLAAEEHANNLVKSWRMDIETVQLPMPPLDKRPPRVEFRKGPELTKKSND
jgi:hypothetical protein